MSEASGNAVKNSSRDERRKVLFAYLDETFLNKDSSVIFSIGRIWRDIGEELSTWGEKYGLDETKKIDSEITKLLKDYGVDYAGRSIENKFKVGRPQHMYRINKANGSEAKKKKAFEQRVEALNALKKASMAKRGYT